MSWSLRTVENIYVCQKVNVLPSPLYAFKPLFRIDDYEETSRHCERLNQKLADQEQKTSVLNDRYASS